MVPIAFFDHTPSAKCDRKAAGQTPREELEPQIAHLHTDRASINGLTEQIIGCAFTVANTLKSGFLEKVYENALAHELAKNGLVAAQQFGITGRI